MKTTPTKPTRPREGVQTMRRLLRAIDRTLVAAAEVKRQRDKLYRLSDQPQREGHP